MSARRTSNSPLEDLMELSAATLKHGVAPAIAIALVWWLTQSVDGKLDQHVQEQRLNLHLIRQICLNTATSEAQRGGCFVDVPQPTR